MHLNHYTCPDTLIVDYRYYGNQLDVASFIYSTVAVVIQIDIQARVLLLVKCCFFNSTDGFTDSNRFIRSNTSRRWKSSIQINAIPKPGGNQVDNIYQYILWGGGGGRCFLLTWFILINHAVDWAHNAINHTFNSVVGIIGASLNKEKMQRYNWIQKSSLAYSSCIDVLSNSSQWLLISYFFTLLCANSAGQLLASACKWWTKPWLLAQSCETEDHYHLLKYAASLLTHE